MTEPKKEPDWWARGIALLSLGLTFYSMFYARASSPYFYASNSQLKFYTEQSAPVDVVDDGGNGGEVLLMEIETKVYIDNNSTTPAKALTLLIETSDPDPMITCDGKCLEEVACGGKYRVEIDRVPANSELLVEIISRHPYETKIVEEQEVVVGEDDNGDKVKVVHPIQTQAIMPPVLLTEIVALQNDFGFIVQDFKRSKSEGCDPAPAKEVPRTVRREKPMPQKRSAPPAPPADKEY